ncbi:hypothetical protein [Methylibium petroleiphilum]
MKNGRTRRQPFGLPARALGSALLWGAVEFVALCRSRWVGRGLRKA